jgi:hypothetical protein
MIFNFRFLLLSVIFLSSASQASEERALRMHGLQMNWSLPGTGEKCKEYHDEINDALNLYTAKVPSQRLTWCDHMGSGLYVTLTLITTQLSESSVNTDLYDYMLEQFQDLTVLGKKTELKRVTEAIVRGDVVMGLAKSANYYEALEEGRSYTLFEKFATGFAAHDYIQKLIYWVPGADGAALVPFFASGLGLSQQALTKELKRVNAIKYAARTVYHLEDGRWIDFQPSYHVMDKKYCGDLPKNHCY